MSVVERAVELIAAEYGPCNDSVNHDGRQARWAAERLADAGLLVADKLQAVLAAALAHRPATGECLAYSCYEGDCDHDGGGECPPVSVTICEACWAVASQINDELVPDVALAKNCPVCVAVTAHLAAQGQA